MFNDDLILVKNEFFILKKYFYNNDCDRKLSSFFCNHDHLFNKALLKAGDHNHDHKFSLFSMIMIDSSNMHFMPSDHDHEFSLFFVIMIEPHTKRLPKYVIMISKSVYFL